MNTVLVIEDDEAVRANLTELLEAEGFHVLEAGDGRTGVRLARERLPEITLCDIMMPDLDGYGVLAELRADPATATLPFLFLTAKTGREAIRRGMDLGADDYLTKPFTREEVLTAIRSRLARQAAVSQRIQAKLDELRLSITLSLPHEFRTPLNGILGFAQILLEDSAYGLPEDVREIAGCIHASALRLHELILNYLLYVDLEIAARDAAYARAFLDRGPARVAGTLVGAVAHRARLARREADVRLELTDASVSVCAPHLEKIATELVQNAFKFSPPSTPVRITGLPTERGYELTVEDRGRGMTAEQIADVGACLQFERKDHEQQGAGLGLAIAKRLVELYGGQLAIESAYGERTAVRVTLPRVRS